MSIRDTLLTAFEMVENGRQGRCVSCQNGDPKKCVNTWRYDHWIAPDTSSWLMSLRDLLGHELAKSVDSGLRVQVWLILGDGERPYVQSCAPSPERYASLKAQGYRVYHTSVMIPEEVDDGSIGSTQGKPA